MSPRLGLLGVVPCVALVSLAAGCSGAPDTRGEEVRSASTTEAITSDDAVSRAMQWVNAKLLYCQSANGQPDYDQACSSVCNRQSNPQWDPYRSDCSGFVSWAWNLPAPGRVTGEFAPFQTDVSKSIQAVDLKPGDACNKSAGGHIVVFKAWTKPGTEAVFMEEPGCSASQPYAHEFTSTVSTSGSTIHIDYEGEDFVAIRYDQMTWDTAPRGSLDGVSCTSIAGWAQDEDNPSGAIGVKLTFDAPDGQTGAGSLDVTASVHRNDLCSSIGSCDHGFDLPMPTSLRDGKSHTIYAYGLDAQTNKLQELPGSPKTLTCAPPALPQGVKRWVASQAVLSAWKFDDFTQMAREPQSDVDALPKGSDLPAAPAVVTADDGSPEVWVIDGSTRRHVADPASMTAWGFTATKWAASKVNALVQGQDWPATPFLFKGDSQPEQYVIDSLPANPGGGGGGGGGSGSGGSGTGASSGSGSAGGGDGFGTGESSGCSVAARDASGAAGVPSIVLAAALAFVRRRRVR